MFGDFDSLFDLNGDGQLDLAEQALEYEVVFDDENDTDDFFDNLTADDFLDNDFDF